MTEKEILQTAKSIIIEEIQRVGFKVIEIILFGSRARGEEREESDWDFYIVVDKDIDFKTKREITMWIMRKLVKQGICSDILIQSREKTEKMKDFVGYVFYDANSEGVRI